MPLTILDFDDGIQQAKNAVTDAMEEFQKEYYAPLVDMQVAKLWQSIPDGIKLQMRQTHKGQMDRLERKLGGK